MVNKQYLLDFMQTLVGVYEEAHFEKISFRYKKKIFATVDQEYKLLCLKLDRIEQDVLMISQPDIIYPVPNKWGLHGWTFIKLSDVKKPILKDALRKAYDGVAIKKKK